MIVGKHKLLNGFCSIPLWIKPHTMPTTPHGYSTLKIIRGLFLTIGRQIKTNSKPRKTVLLKNSKRKSFKRKKKGSRLTFAVQDGNVIGGQSRLGLDTDQQGASTSGSNALAWEMNALETQREGAFLFRNKNDEKCYISKMSCENFKSLTSCWMTCSTNSLKE